MAGIYIPGMAMPMNCCRCPCADLEYYDCNLMPGTGISSDRKSGKRLDNCPLVSVHDHGRLGDLDALYRRIKTECNPYGSPTIGYDDGLKVLGIIGSTPPIIPEDEEGPL